MTSFRRYTNLTALVHLLQQKTVTLLNPATWDDKNDAYYMAEYKRYKDAKTILALCFAEASERYHHWRVFSHGADGVCIEFEKETLLSSFPKSANLKRGYVTYKAIKESLSAKTIDLEKLPFLKRIPYKDEHEYRVIYVDYHNAMEFNDYPIKIDCIRRITLSPWMPSQVRDSVRDVLRAIDGCSELSISYSTLIENETWKSFTSRVKA